MQFTETRIRGAFLLEPEMLLDERGFFARTWCRREFAKRGLNADLVECSISFNKKKGTLRGMHYQNAPYGEAKLVRCTRGAIYDVVLDLRPDSPTFGQWTAAELTADNHRMLFVPEGCAHGFQSLADGTEVFYQVSMPYVPEAARGVRWDDPAFAIRWPLQPTILSVNDRTYPDWMAASLGRRPSVLAQKEVKRMTVNIPVFKPLLRQEEIAAAVGALEMGWLGMGSYVGQFEAAVKRYLGAEDRHVVAVSTGHAALHLAFLLLGIGPGDEVITPSFNNIADFQAILATGASPVFCDIDDDSLCIDLDKAEQLITSRTKAIAVMDYDCILCDHRRIAALAEKYRIRVVHDAAHSFGSRHEGRMVGSFSDITMFSFDPVKTLTCIDGGVLVVRTPEEAEILREMRLIGMGQPSSIMYQDKRAWTYDVKRLGFRYHMANLHAAIGLAQLARVELITATRREVCRCYNERLGRIPQLRVPNTDFAEVTPFLYYVRVPAGRRDAFRACLAEQHVDTGIHWQPGHWFSLLKNCLRGDLSVTERVGHEVVSLPLHSDMAPQDVEAVCGAVESFFARG